MGFFGSIWDALDPTSTDTLKEQFVNPITDLLSGDLSTTSALNFLTAGAYSQHKFPLDLWDRAIKNLTEFPEGPQEAVITGNKNSNIAKRPVIYGTRGRVGGTRVFIGASGANNEYLHIVLDICEGEIEAIDDVYINEVISTDDKYSGLVTITRYVGTEDQAADPDLVASFPDYTEAHQLKGIAYLHIKLKYDSAAFSGFPAVTCDVRGLKLYDPRTDTTYFSANPALCVRDYVTDPIYGKGLPEALIDDVALELEADYCDTQVQTYEGALTTYALLECNMYLDTAQTITNNLKLLLASCRGALPRLNGGYKLVIERDAPSVFSFNSDNIIGGWSYSGTSKDSKFNKVEVNYTNEGLDWKSDIVTILSTIFQSQDGGFLLAGAFTPTHLTDQYRAKDYASLELKRSRQGLSGSFLATPEALSVIPGSIVDITHTSPGWVGKTFRVIDLGLAPTGLIMVSWTEHEPSVYDRDVPIEYVPPPDTNLPDPEDVIPPTGIILDSGDEYLKVSGDGTVISRIFAEWTAPVGYPYVVKYVVEYKAVADVEWIPAPSVISGSSKDIYIGPVNDGVFYHVRIKTVGPNDAESAWLVSAAHSVIGKLAPPPDVDNFTVIRQSDGTRQFDWALTSPPADLAGFKIRYKLSPDQVWADMTPLHDGLLVLTPYETNLLAAGVYTVGIKAVDTSGNESENAVLINSVLGDPRIPISIYGVDVRRAEGWPGTKTDCWHSISDGALYAEDNKTWDDFFTDGIDWDNWNQYARSPKSPIIYEHPAIDLGAVLSFVPLVAVSGNGTLTVEESHSDDDITYTAWAVTGPQFSARYVKIRVTCVVISGIPSITEMFINLSAEVTEEDINDLVTSTVSAPAGVLRLPLAKTYATITQVAIALQNVGAGWTWELIDKNVSTGPQIKIYNGSGVLADATIDAHIKGV